VEILGNTQLLQDIVSIAAGQHSTVQDNVSSNIVAIAAAIDWNILARSGSG
jgi:hypothetical protein